MTSMIFLLLLACGPDPVTEVLIPEHFQGSYDNGEENPFQKKRITVSPTGLSNEEISLTINESSIDGDTYTIKKGLGSGYANSDFDGTCSGSLKLQGDRFSLGGNTLLVHVAGEAEACGYFSGTYTPLSRKSADPIPKDLRKKWYSPKEHVFASGSSGKTTLNDQMVMFTSNSITWSRASYKKAVNDNVWNRPASLELKSYTVSDVTGVYDDGIFKLATGTMPGFPGSPPVECYGTFEEMGAEMVVSIRCYDEKESEDGSFKFTLQSEPPAQTTAELYGPETATGKGSGTKK